MSKRRMILLSFFIICMIFPITPASGQTRHTLSGIIIDEKTKEPLESVNIIVKNTKNGCATDSSGRFAITLPAEKHIFQFLFIGYKTIEKTIDLSGGPVSGFTLAMHSTPIQSDVITITEDNAPHKYQPQEYVVQKRMLKEIPVQIEDVYQIIKTLPGVSSASDKSSEFTIRGSHFDEHLSLIHGVPVSRPFHLKAGSLESISIINNEMISNVQFFPGGFPSRYGWKLSSAMDISYRRGSRESFKPTVSFNTTGANVVLEGPAGKSGSYIVGVRKSFLNYYFSKIRPFAHGQGDFRDVQGNLSFDIGKNFAASLIFLYGKSGYKYNADNHEYYQSFPPGLSQLMELYNRLNGFEDNAFQTGLAILKLEYNSSESTRLSAYAARYKESDNETSSFEKEGQDEPFGGFPSFYSYETSSRNNAMEFNRDYFRIELERKFHRKVSVLIGGEAAVSDISERLSDTFKLWEDGSLSADQSFYNDYHTDQNLYSAYADIKWEPAVYLALRPGLRVQNDKLTGDLTFSPSLTGSYLLNIKTKLFGSAGYYYQPPSFEEFRTVSVPEKYVYLNQKGYQLISGIEWEGDSGGAFKLEAYYKFNPLTSPYIFEKGRYRYENGKTGKSEIFGFDVSFSGMLSKNVLGTFDYSYLHARELTDGSPAGWIPRSTDRTHLIKCAFVHSVNPESGYKFHFIFTLGTGYPYTPKLLQKTENGTYTVVDGSKNSLRYRTYKRLDIRWSKTYRQVGFAGGHGDAVLYFEMLNIWDMRNTLEYKYEFFAPSLLIRKPVFLTPRMINGGIKFTFFKKSQNKLEL